LEDEISPIHLVCQQPDFIAAAKNKKTLSSLHDAVNTALANGKIAADSVAKDIRTKFAWYKENAKGYEVLFADLQSIVYEPIDDFQMLVGNRVAQHKLDEKQKLDDERARIQAEEKKKAEEKIRAEEAAAKAVNERPSTLAVVMSAVAPAEVAQVFAETPKPAVVKSSAKPTGVSPALITLARHELSHFRKKFAPIAELAAVMREIDSYLEATKPTEAEALISASPL
jgi:hypothetical protein